MTPTGTLTTLYNFCALTGCADGGVPNAGVVLGTDGNFYGTAGGGGASIYWGTVFKITPGGALTTLYSFCSQANCADGADPNASLVLGSDGNFYGTAFAGGANDSCSASTFVGCGTVFKMTADGTLTTLHSFDGTDGSAPNGLVQAPNGNFYGTTGVGGNQNCSLGCGTFFEITSAGTLTTLHQFHLNDGAYPAGSIIQATDGNIYGTAQEGGANNLGTIYRITPGGTLKTLHALNSNDGAFPFGGLAQATNGAFYGTTYFGGAFGDGTLFSLSVGLGPFVETSPSSGRAGAPVKILGTDLRGATGVSFNGTAAAFTVVSQSLISTTVPAGATTGKIGVTTPSGTLKSNVNFLVRP